MYSYIFRGSIGPNCKDFAIIKVNNEEAVSKIVKGLNTKSAKYITKVIKYLFAILYVYPLSPSWLNLTYYAPSGEVKLIACNPIIHLLLSNGIAFVILGTDKRLCVNLDGIAKFHYHLQNF